jgi:hypothetical protein
MDMEEFRSTSCQKLPVLRTQTRDGCQKDGCVEMINGDKKSEKAD